MLQCAGQGSQHVQGAARRGECVHAAYALAGGDAWATDSGQAGGVRGASGGREEEEGGRGAEVRGAG
eukprot:365520-Chlamydomonas_euryale.AAC.18